MAATPQSKRAFPSRPSPAANNIGEWFRQAERLVRVVRARGALCPEAVQLTERLVETFAELVQHHAPIVLRCSPLELWLRDELILHHAESEPGDRGVPLLLFRDGIRGLEFSSAATRGDARTLLGALARVAAAPASHEDLSTLLWRADLDGMTVELAPLEELVPASQSAAPGADHEAAAAPTLGLIEGGAAAEARAGLDVSEAWRELEAHAAAAERQWREAWDAAATRRWTEQAETFVDDVLAYDGGPLAREALATSLSGWLAGAAQRCDWVEAALAHERLRRADPAKRWHEPLLADALAGLDVELVTARLDDADRETQGRFFAFAVRVGRPALDLLVRVLARSARARVRAAATAALGYVCGDDATALAPYLRDARWPVARNIVFALGQLGGEDASEPLALALAHPDVRVRRAAVAALGQVPVHRRTPPLLRHLDSPDPDTLRQVLGMLAREPDRRTSAALAERIVSADFESRPEEVRLALIATLAEIADARALPALGTVLTAGGWFARRTPERTAAAHALARIGAPEALALLQDGLRSRAEAVRTACREAFDERQRRMA